MIHRVRVEKKLNHSDTEVQFIHRLRRFTQADLPPEPNYGKSTDWTDDPAPPLAATKDIEQEITEETEKNSSLQVSALKQTEDVNIELKASCDSVPKKSSRDAKVFSAPSRNSLGIQKKRTTDFTDGTDENEYLVIRAIRAIRGPFCSSRFTIAKRLVPAEGRPGPFASFVVAPYFWYRPKAGLCDSSSAVCRQAASQT